MLIYIARPYYANKPVLIFTNSKYCWTETFKNVILMSREDDFEKCIDLRWLDLSLHSSLSFSYNNTTIFTVHLLVTSVKADTDTFYFFKVNEREKEITLLHSSHNECVYTITMFCTASICIYLSEIVIDFSVYHRTHKLKICIMYVLLYIQQKLF